MTDVALEFLSLLEGLEARLLCWGYVDGGHGRAELVELAEQWVIQRDPSGTSTGESIVDALERRGLIVAVSTGSEDVYRSRMAETVRLAARLRQLSPKHAGGASWSTA